MAPAPTGRLVRTAIGADLILPRLINGSIDDVWASLTENNRTARWIGRWEGDAAPGATVRLQMGFEEGAPWSEIRINSCEPPTRLGVTMMDEAGDWPLVIRLAARNGLTELTLIQHCRTTAAIETVGPGWEFYLDALIASREDRPLPAFEVYYPALSDYYRAAADTL